MKLCLARTPPQAALRSPWRQHSGELSGRRVLGPGAESVRWDDVPLPDVLVQMLAAHRARYSGGPADPLMLEAVRGSGLLRPKPFTG